MSSSSTFNTIGLPFIHLKSIKNSNTFLLDKLRNNLAAHGTAVFADEQTAGKGQMGKVWKSEPCQNIILSLAIDVSFIPINNQFCISVMVALGCYKFFCKYAGEETTIKWPNDIYWRERKAGGILIETLNSKKWKMENGDWGKKRFAVVGIGININQTVFSEGVKNPVSLKQITGKQFNVVDLAKELCTCINDEYVRLQNDKQTQQLIELNKILFKQNEIVKLKKEQIIFSCVIKGVNEYGKLLVQHSVYESFNLHEVEWMI